MNYQDRHQSPSSKWTIVSSNSHAAGIFRKHIDHLCNRLAQFHLSAIEFFAVQLVDDTEAQPALILNTHPPEASKMGHLREFVDKEALVNLIRVREVILRLGMIEQHRRGVKNDEFGVVSDIALKPPPWSVIVGHG